MNKLQLEKLKQIQTNCKKVPTTTRNFKFMLIDTRQHRIMHESILSLIPGRETELQLGNGALLIIKGIK